MASMGNVSSFLASACLEEIGLFAPILLSLKERAAAEPKEIWETFCKSQLPSFETLHRLWPRFHTDLKEASRSAGHVRSAAQDTLLKEIADHLQHVQAIPPAWLPIGFCDPSDALLPVQAFLRDPAVQDDALLLPGISETLEQKRKQLDSLCESWAKCYGPATEASKKRKAILTPEEKEESLKKLKLVEDEAAQMKKRDLEALENQARQHVAETLAAAGHLQVRNVSKNVGLGLGNLASKLDNNIRAFWTMDGEQQKEFRSELYSEAAKVLGAVIKGRAELEKSEPSEEKSRVAEKFAKIHEATQIVTEIFESQGRSMPMKDLCLKAHSVTVTLSPIFKEDFNLHAPKRGRS
jgi:hypothetical protein